MKKKRPSKKELLRDLHQQMEERMERAADLKMWELVEEKYGRPDDDDVCDPFVHALEDEDKIIRDIAIDVLILLNDLHAAAEVLWILSHGSKHARIAAAEVLGGLGGDLAIRTLMDALDDPDKDIDTAVICALKKLTVSIPVEI